MIGAPSLRLGIAFVAALLVLPVLQFAYFFLISGGPQSVRGGLDPGYVSKYLGIWLYFARWTIVIVGICGSAVLLIANRLGHYSRASILLASIPTAVVSAFLFFVLAEKTLLVDPVILVVAVMSGLIASLTFCVAAGVPRRARVSGGS